MIEYRGEKTCTKCGEAKGPEKFASHKSTKDGLNSWCRACHNAKSHESKRKKRTGWGVEAFQAAWEAQRGRCAICMVPMRKDKKAHNSVMADHCHAAKATRALLCSGCNRGLGCFHDDPEALRRAADYLDHHND